MSEGGKKTRSFIQRSAIVKWLIESNWNRLTPAGRTVFYGVLASMALGASSMDVPIYVVWCLATSLLIVSAMVSFFVRPRVEASRKLPRHVSAGETLKYEVEVINRGGRRARYLEMEESDLPPGLLAGKTDCIRVNSLEPGGELKAPFELNCAKRGVYALPPISVTSSFPSLLTKSKKALGSEQKLIVYPSFRKLGEFRIPSGRRYQPGGFAMSSDVGDSTEFMSTREFREGDNIRDIHWASWARTQKPVVKVFQEEYFVRLAMLLDSEVRGDDDRAFEEGISLAASVADVLSRQDYIIDIFAAGEKIYKFQAGRSLAHFDNILEILSCITHNPKVEMGSVLDELAHSAENLSALVCIMMDWDEPRKKLVKSLNTLGLATRTIVVRDKEPTISIAGEPAVSWFKVGAIPVGFS